jgi:hypothetical protein
LTLENINYFVFSPFSDDNTGILSYYEKKGLNLQNTEDDLKDLRKKYPDLAIQTYIDSFGLENISDFEDCYIGQFENEDDIKKEYKGEYFYEEEFAFVI